MNGIPLYDVLEPLQYNSDASTIAVDDNYNTIKVTNCYNFRASLINRSFSRYHEKHHPNRRFKNSSGIEEKASH